MLRKNTYKPLFAASLAIICTMLSLGNFQYVTSQEVNSLLKKTEYVVLPSINFSVDKLANTFIFTGLLQTDLPVAGGRLFLYNQYRGSAFRTTTTAVRDDEEANVTYRYPVSPDIAVLGRSSWVLSRDSRLVGLSSLERLNGAAGIAVTLPGNLESEAIAGVERTMQLGVTTTGPLVAVRAVLEPTMVDVVELAGDVLGDWHRIDDTRTNSDIVFRMSVRQVSADSSELLADVSGQQVGRQYLTSVSGSSTPDAVEERVERNIHATSSVRYMLQPAFGVSAKGNAWFTRVARGFGNPVDNAPLSAITRTLTEGVVDAEGAILWHGSQFAITAGLGLYIRMEENTVDRRFDVADADLTSFQQQEFMRDNRTYRSRAFIQGLYVPTEKDSVSVDYSWWLLRYDTPSDGNADDRDELNTSALVRYSRRMSSTLQVGAELGLRNTHLVFLKAARSAFNNQNYVIRFTPFLSISAGILQAVPQMEILANYTVYDFEGKGASARSYSFRQLSYRDSVRLKILPTITLELPLLVRYFERSVLLWSSFSETPQAGSLEYLVSALLIDRSVSGCDIGAGVRLYTLEQASLESPLGTSNIMNAVYSIAPEAVLRYRTRAGSELRFSGWYEFQELRPSGNRELPNFILSARIVL